MKRSIIVLMLLSLFILCDQISYTNPLSFFTTQTNTATPATMTMSVYPTASQTSVVGTMHRKRKIQRFNTQVDLYLKDHPDCTREEAIQSVIDKAKEKTDSD